MAIDEDEARDTHHGHVGEEEDKQHSPLSSPRRLRRADKASLPRRCPVGNASSKSDPPRPRVPYSRTDPAPVYECVIVSWVKQCMVHEVANIAHPSTRTTIHPDPSDIRIRTPQVPGARASRCHVLVLSSPFLVASCARRRHSGRSSRLRKWLSQVGPTRGAIAIGSQRHHENGVQDDQGTTPCIVTPVSVNMR